MLAIQTTTGPASRSIVKYSSSGLVMAEYRSVSIALWRCKPNRELFEIQRRHLGDLVARNPGQAAFVCIVEPSADPPDDDIRKASSAMISAHEKNLKCVALVIEGVGFRAALTRMVLSGIVMLTRTPAPIKFFDVPKAACLWVGTQLPVTRDGLHQEIEALRAQLVS